FGGGTWDVAVMEFNSSGVRQWATWYGGLQNDLGTGIATDAGGNSYFTGYTNSSTFPVLFAPQSSKGVGYDAFISKFNSSGTPQWSTFYGGDDDDKGRAICLDASASNVYVTGSTLSGVLATTAGVFQSSNASAYNAEDVFIIKMSSAHVPIFATYSGGSDADFGQGIATDNNGNVFVTGYTLSSDMPLLDAGNGAYFDGTIGSAGTHDAFLLECNSTGTARIWSTYFGGMSVDMGLGIAYDPFIGLYVCGNTASTDFPVQQPSDLNYYQSTQGDGGNYNDMFIAWFGTNDSLRWNTYYGGSTSDEAYGVAVDANHNIFVAGLDSNDIRVLKFGPGMPTGILCTDIYILDDFMYPDPATDQLNFNFLQKNDGEVSFDFISMTGQLVKHEERSFVSCSCNTPSRYNFDVSELAKGTYFLRVTSSERTSTRKFVKQ
ncbi:MAG TPA: SBBP repeat-containing protein, partial [Bacteroidia bacterium]|nr:SBBP repeat-containing protein [Bacteroidia bacterium]